MRRRHGRHGSSTCPVPGRRVSVARMLIYHICRRDEWQGARRAGIYRGSSQDKADGFIHFSTKDTVRESAAKHRAGQAGLVLIAVEASSLGRALRWEESRGGIAFPHLYGALHADHVKWVRELPLGEADAHVFPALE
jgi:uncharacterized protein (DUF952 family)